MAQVLARVGQWPERRIGDVGELSSDWGPSTAGMVSLGTRLARGEASPFDASPADALVIGLADAVRALGAPLLIDADAAAVHGAVCRVMAPASSRSDSLFGQHASSGSGLVVEAEACAGHDSFEDALRAAWDVDVDRELAMTVTGALAGARLGVTAIPSRWLTYVSGEGAGRRQHHRDLLRLADRFVGLQFKFPPEPRRRLGPVEVIEGVWAANIHRVESFCRQHPDGAVISMCPMGDVLDAHPVRRSFLIDDVATKAANPRLEEVVDELMETIASFRAEGRQVLVHCHHGVSRTGLALRAWLMREEGFSESEATSEVEARWPWLSTANVRFTKLLGSREPSLP